MTDERADLILDVLKETQADLAEVRREQVPQGLRLSALADHSRGTLTTLYGIQADVAHLKVRVDCIEERLALRETEH